VIAPDKRRGFRAYTTKLHDGDSFWVMADTGFGGRAEPELRLLDVHAPELDRMALPPYGQPGGAETTGYVTDWLMRADALSGESRWSLWVETVMVRSGDPLAGERRTFARYLATVWRIGDCPTWGQGGAANFSLNYQVALYLSGHPEWPPGE
jgi:hypothetical protein